MLQALSSFVPAPGNAVAPAWMAICLAVFFAAVLLLAFGIDRRWGEPPSRLHPVVWIGNYLQFAGSFAVRCKPAPAFLLGALGWLVGAVVCGFVAWVIQEMALDQVLQCLVGATGTVAMPGLWLHAVMLLVTFMLMTVTLKCLFSWRMLLSEVSAVEAALGESLDRGRERLSWLVSRDTSRLTASEVRESAIESLAENLNDSVVAPLFWFILFGLPGAAIYRFANTADAMWGYPGMYRGKNWQWAGKWAAHADDLLSWIPARLTAWLLVSAARDLKLSAVREEARKTPSPNSGWPMGAMALALGVRLCKPDVYTLNPGGRAPEAADTARAKKIACGAISRLLPGALLAFALIVLPGILSGVWRSWA